MTAWIYTFSMRFPVFVKLKNNTNLTFSIYSISWQVEMIVQRKLVKNLYLEPVQWWIVILRVSLESEIFPKTFWYRPSSCAFLHLLTSWDDGWRLRTVRKQVTEWKVRDNSKFREIWNCQRVQGNVMLTSFNINSSFKSAWSSFW